MFIQLTYLICYNFKGLDYKKNKIKYLVIENIYTLVLGYISNH